ncbi:hypothetical protein DERF_002108 [Dermatophagoides farinae]|uniref:Uncharacterized protein n=1 Tax=Dermatophagoides farinae TaxID=6954 RepID=A0A922IG11_DERFA|nr:hypothetical protein DERF_002108 [Dermatophagoides farinae]
MTTEILATQTLRYRSPSLTPLPPQTNFLCIHQYTIFSLYVFDNDNNNNNNKNKIRKNLTRR